MANLINVKEFLKLHGVEFEEDKPLSQITWIKRGGNASVFIQPRSSLDLINVVKLLRKNNFDFDLIGGTSNLYCKETYNPEIVISTLKVNRYNLDEEFIECDCGVQSSIFAQKCCEKGLAGFEGLVSLPGTIGGAICNNASAFNCSFSSKLHSIHFVDTFGEEKEHSVADLHFSHRSSALKDKSLKGTIISCKFCKEISASNLTELAEKNKTLRKETQQGPLQNLGSVFTGNKIKRLKPSDFSSKIKYIKYLCFMAWLKYIAKNSPENRVKYKKFILNILDYPSLDPYVSDKNLNCFIWADSSADQMFELYREFMQRFNISSTLEIEIRE